MDIKITEDEQGHIYACLLVGNTEFSKIKKSLAKLNREDESIDEEIQRNANLRRLFNPRADEEARERDRAKKDPAQLDIEGATETGGSTKLRLVTDPAMTDEQMRDALIDLGLTMPLTAIRAFDADARGQVETWIGEAVAAHQFGGTIPNEPDVVATFSVPNETVEERVELGPYGMIDRSTDDGPCFDIEHRETHEVKESMADPFDAAFFAAQLNIERLRLSEMSDADVATWAVKGPWFPVNHGDGDASRWMIEAGSQTERCASQDEAFGTAARYNRSITERDTAASWSTDKPVRLSDDEVQEILAANEADATEGAGE